jgi:hypothetical protein
MQNETDAIERRKKEKKKKRKKNPIQIETQKQCRGSCCQ